MAKTTLHRDQKVALYGQAVDALSGAVLKGATIPYTSLNGHMYSFLTKEDVLALKLPVGEKETFLTKYKTTLVEQYGIIQKEFVVVPDALLKKTGELIPWFQISYNYVSGLKPKPTAKTKKKE